MPEPVYFSQSVRINTIDIPILFGYKLLDLKLLNVRTFAGPNFRFDAGSSIPDFTTDGFRNAALGFQAGVGADVLMLTFDIRYNYTGNLFNAGTPFGDISRNEIIFTLGWKIL